MAALAASALLSACGHSRERLPYDFERMRVQQRYGLYGASRTFGDGQSMQAPPAGTVSREEGLNSGLTGVVVTPALVARGESRFTIYCAVCHGAGGFGGSLVAENMGIPRPPSLRTPDLRAKPLSYLVDVMTHGKGRMPPYAAELNVSDRWAIVAYVQQLQASGPLTPEQREDSLRALLIHRMDSTAAATTAAAK